MTKFLRGDIWWVDFQNSRGREIKKIRPAVIVSRNAYNKHLDCVQVVACTSNTNKVYTNETLVLINKKVGKALAHQLFTVTKSRLLKRIGKLTLNEISGIDQTLAIQLGL